jgi:hypothetical protein
MHYGNMAWGNLTTFSKKTIHWLKFHKGLFVSMLSTNHMVESIGANIHTILQPAFNLHSTSIKFSEKVGQHFIWGDFRLTVHQKIVWWSL